MFSLKKVLSRPFDCPYFYLPVHNPVNPQPKRAWLVRELKITISVFISGELPLLKLIPSLESFNILGVELKFQKDLEETRRHLNDLQSLGDEKMKHYIFQFVNEKSLTGAGKKKLKEWKEAADVPR